MSKGCVIIGPQLLLSKKRICENLTNLFPDFKVVSRNTDCYIDTYDSDQDTIKYVSLIVNELNDMILEDYVAHPNGTEEFEEQLLESNFVYISYNYFSFLKVVLSKLLLHSNPALNKVWVDDDYNNILSGEEIYRWLNKDEPSSHIR